MKILITTFTYPPNADGVAEHASVLANGLARRGHEVVVATEFHPERKTTDCQGNPRVEQFRISGFANWRAGIAGDPGERKRYQDFLEAFSCDLLVCSCWDVWSTYLAYPVLERIAQPKVLVSHGYTAHIWCPDPKPFWGLGLWLGGWHLVLRAPFHLRKFDQLVVQSRRAAFDRFFDHWLARATRYGKVSVIPNGAFPAEFAGDLPDFRAEFGIGPGPLLIYVANYCDRKNQTMAVRAFRRAGIRDGTLVLIGSEFNEFSDEAAKVDRELKANYPDGRVVVLEKVSRVKKCAAYKAADLFLLSAKAETQPVALIEAMASHTPFLSTDVGGIRELPGGIVVRSEEEMVEKLRELMASSTRRQQLAEQGWKACQTTFDWDRVVETYERLFLRIVAERNGTAGGSR